MRVVWLCVLVLACEVDADDRQFLCGDGECPPGQRCVGGVCVEGDVDGGMDAALDAPELDAGPDAPVVDVPDVDAFDGPESCDRAANGMAVDEDGNGSFDEGCDFTFGEPHPVTNVHVSRGGNHFSPELSSDGLHLYFAHGATPGGGVFRATRPSLDAPFGRAEVFLDERVDSATIIDESELYIQRDGEILPVRDGTVQEALEITLPGRTVEGAFHPSVSRDGLELLVAATIDDNRDILLSRRARRSDDFTTWQPATSGDANDEFPRFAHDRLSLLFTRSGTTMISRRSMPTASFGPPEPFPGLPADAVQPFYHPQTREMFMSRVGTPEWAPAGISIWRVEVCREGFACVTEPPDCPSGATSPDGWHCYSLADAMTAHAEIDCGEGFAATVHSDEEIAVLARVRDSLTSDVLVWLGGRRAGVDAWDNGEPFLYTELSVADPDGCYALRVDAPRWVTTSCTEAHLAFCEVDVWPNWLSL